MALTGLVEIKHATAASVVEEARLLFREYADSIGLDLCFQNFSQELASLPGEYGPPLGRLLVATLDGAPAACIALRPLGGRLCELKRMFVRQAFRGRGIARRLAEQVIGEARRIGYERMRLDTLPTMRAAVALYRSLGFREVAPYCVNPVPGALFFELDLKTRDHGAR